MNNSYLIIIALFVITAATAQEKDSVTAAFKKRVLDNTEIELLTSAYGQNGSHSAVGGGIGDEHLTDFATNLVVAIPLNYDDVLTIDAGISAYTSASSSNINPFMSSSGNNDDGEDDDDRMSNKTDMQAASGASAAPADIYGTPWQASSGASASDNLLSFVGGYSHSSENRNTIVGGNVSFSNEFDYTSFGLGGSLAKLFNQKNTELSLKLNAYLDKWRPIYPAELEEYLKYNTGFSSQGYLKGVPIWDKNGVDVMSEGLYHPTAFTAFTSNNRNSYSASISFSQILSKTIQMSLFVDVLYQQGLLSTPYQRVYFEDKPAYYIGKPEFIPVYESYANTGVYRLADDVERLPGTRFKLPIGTRINFYIAEFLVAKTYYRYYQDDWGLKSHTVSLELPIKISQYFTLYPAYRYYTQNAADYFAPFAQHLSTEKYYTSDFDLSKLNSNQYSFGISYNDVLTKLSAFGVGLKSIDFRFSHYQRSDNLSANIGSLGIKFIK